MLKSVVKGVNRIVYGAAPKDAPASLAQIPMVQLDGSPLPADAIAGKAILFVNVASKCGLTPQYEGLQALYDKNKDRGLVIVGVPCNQFLGQEPGGADQIASFCSLTYGVDFPLLAKQEVNGANRSPLYRWLIASPAGKGQDITWNFEKFVVDRQGKVVARFEPAVKPDAPELVGAIERVLR